MILVVAVFFALCEMSWFSMAGKVFAGTIIRLRRNIHHFNSSRPAPATPECRFQPGSSSLRHAHHFTPQGSQGHRLVQCRQFNRINEFLELRVVVQSGDENKPPGQRGI